MLSTERQLATILEHANALATVARDQLDARVPGCPAWDVAGLLEHLIDVHWFWAYDVENRLEAHFEGERPETPAREDLVDHFLAGARHLVAVLDAADPNERVWTWAPTNQTVAFVSRHQVQEMVVHHVDGARAVGQDAVIAPDVGMDCVDEFLTYSLSSVEDPKVPPPRPLDTSITLRATDGEARWTISDASTPGTVDVVRGGDVGDVTVAAPAGELLLWLYGRMELVVPGMNEDVRARFRTLTYTD